jgi:hypothetical protein
MLNVTCKKLLSVKNEIIFVMNTMARTMVFLPSPVSFYYFAKTEVSDNAVEFFLINGVSFLAETFPQALCRAS